MITRYYRTALRSIAVLLTATQLFFARNEFGTDCQSYGDIARAYLRHDWAMAVNAYWSPLYSWLMALTLLLGKPSLRWELPLFHLLNFCIFIISLVAFEFFWSGLLAANAPNQTVAKPDEHAPLPTFALWILGYALFIWLTISIVGAVNPDLGVAAVVLFVAGLLVRIKASRAATVPKHLVFWLGVALGLGYLVKAVMFPMALVFLCVTLLFGFNRQNAANVGLALLIFIAIAAPQIIVLSKAKGRFTFSDTGKFAFAWSNYGWAAYNWQGEPPGSGYPLHPTRLVNTSPRMFEFNGPIRASYPPWYDPSYWNDGMSAKIQFGIVFRHFVGNAGSILGRMTRPKVWFAGVIVLLLFCDPRDTARGVWRSWYLVVPAICVFGAYSLTFVESRYLPAWLLMVWGSILAGLRLKRFSRLRLIPQSVAIATATLMLVSMSYGLYGQSKAEHHGDAKKDYSIAEGLTQLGLNRGDKVGSIGFNNDANWAYLDGLMIVAEINTEGVCPFWNLNTIDKSKVLDKFARSGAKAVIANADHQFKSSVREKPWDFATCARLDHDWQRIGNSEDYLYVSKAEVREPQ